jgi:hypothetical protein
MDAFKVGFRWLKREGDTEYFVVGTLPEFESYRRTSTSRPSGSEKHASDNSKGRSGGRGGRRNRGDPTGAGGNSSTESP